MARSSAKDDIDSPVHGGEIICPSQPARRGAARRLVRISIRDEAFSLNERRRGGFVVITAHRPKRSMSFTIFWSSQKHILVTVEERVPAVLITLR
jgi:hypothetical protein